MLVYAYGDGILIIDENNNTVSTFRQAVANAGLVFDVSVTDSEINGVLNRQSGEINFSLAKDKKTITGYMYVVNDDE